MSDLELRAGDENASMRMTCERPHMLPHLRNGGRPSDLDAATKFTATVAGSALSRWCWRHAAAAVPAAPAHAAAPARRRPARRQAAEVLRPVQQMPRATTGAQRSSRTGRHRGHQCERLQRSSSPEDQPCTKIRSSRSPSAPARRSPGKARRSSRRSSGSACPAATRRTSRSSRSPACSRRSSKSAVRSEGAGCDRRQCRQVVPQRRQGLRHGQRHLLRQSEQHQLQVAGLVLAEDVQGDTATTVPTT